MTTYAAHITATELPTEQPSHRVRRNWLGLWAFLTAFAVFEIVKHGFVNGSPGYAVSLIVISVGSFVAPDLTFLVGVGDEVVKGSISTRAVPFYNAAHRMSVAFVFTAVIGLGLAPLNSSALAVFVGGLSWMAHIAMDRTAGYGLRNPDGSRNAH